MADVTKTQRRTRGFERASGLLKSRIRKVSESRGFSESKVLTHWSEFVGQDIAAIARPVNVTYGRGAFGATLTLLTTGAQAPILQMQVEKIRERVNAAYGYAAIQHVKVTQTAPTGFAEGQVEFQPAPKAKPKKDPAIQEKAVDAATGVADEDLRQALEMLGENVLSRKKPN